MEIKKGDFVIIRIRNYPDTAFENKVGKIFKVLGDEEYSVKFLESIKFRENKGKTWDIHECNIYRVLKRNVNCPNIVLK